MPSKDRSRARRGVLCLLAGAALMLAGAYLLAGTPDLLEYVLPVSAGDGEALLALYEQGGEQMEALAGTVESGAMAARAQSVPVSAESGSVTATVYAVSEGYFDVVHETLLAGRFVSESDVRRGTRALVLDSGAALSLFAGEEPIGREATVDGRTYEVVGVIRGGRRIGETDAHVAYVPVTAAGHDALPAQTFACVARPLEPVASAIQMQDTLVAWRDGGSFYSLAKLKLGAVMPLRWALLIAGAVLIFALLHRVNAFAWGRVCRYARRLRVRYARELLPGMLGSAALCLLLYGALAGALFALAAFSIRPLYVFTEWVPEVVVELSSLQSRFFALSGANAAAVRCVTRSVCCVELGRGLLRWGFFAALLGLVLRGWAFVNRRVPLEPFPRER